MKQPKILLLQQPWRSNDCKRKSKRSNILTTNKNKLGDFGEMGRLGKVKVDEKTDGWPLGVEDEHR